MADGKKPGDQNGGVSISAGSVTVGGDVVGRDKITTTTHSVGAEGLAQLSRQLAHIKQQIDERPADPTVDKDELKGTVERIEREVRKGGRQSRQGGALAEIFGRDGRRRLPGDGRRPLTPGGGRGEGRSAHRAEGQGGTHRECRRNRAAG